MTSFRLPEDMETKLDELCRLTQRTKSFYMKEALSKYMEDMEDIYISLERISKPNRKLYTTKEVLKKLEE